MTAAPGPSREPREAGAGPGVRARRRTLGGQRPDLLGAIAVGGALGAEARYGLGLALPHAAGGFPWSTLLVNLSGCFLIGILMVVVTDLAEPHRLVRPFLGVGVLGGYTTFSTYSTELVQLLDAGRPGPALAYLVVTPFGALAAAWAGSALTRATAALLIARSHRTRRRGGRP
ncbi:MAG TPA: fluoride efflux transporter CrcB [Pseudonocardia sp.]|nr:fluoride efflux transporter CrcB [Pseudonocardia sp.]